MTQTSSDIDNDAVNHVYEASLDLEELDPQFLEVIETYHEYYRDDEQNEQNDFPQYQVMVTIEDDGPSEGTYCYPIAEHAREEWGLFLFDTVTNWREETVKLRFGYEPDTDE